MNAEDTRELFRRVAEVSAALYAQYKQRPTWLCCPDVQSTLAVLAIIEGRLAVDAERGALVLTEAGLQWLVEHSDGDADEVLAWAQERGYAPITLFSREGEDS